jgi:hypothetical protein
MGSCCCDLADVRESKKARWRDATSDHLKICPRIDSKVRKENKKQKEMITFTLK